jgi:TetR/AcrR family tetracycline transcriptional repressor
MTRRGPGQRAGLDGPAVLDAAREIVDGEGVEGLSMRRLADRLGVMPNALYVHFPSKSALLDGLLDSVLADVRTPDAARVDWQDGLARLFRSTRRVLLSHPGLVRAYLERPGTSENAMRLGEVALDLLRRGGLEGRRASDALRVLLIFSLGFVAVESPRREDPEGRIRLARGMATFATAGPPDIRAAARHLARHPGDREFEAGLRWLLAGIADEVEMQRSP